MVLLCGCHQARLGHLAVKRDAQRFWPGRFLLELEGLGRKVGEREVMEDKSERQRKHFNQIAHKYYLARRHRNHLLLKDLMWHEILDDKKFLCKKGLRVLEPMCGFADGKAILENVLGVSTVYTGFDYSESVITALKEKQRGLNVSQANIEHYQTDELFDVIILLGGLHHVPHIAKKVVSQLAGNLAPGGIFINLEPTSGNRIFSKVRDIIYRRNPLFDEQTERAFLVEELFEMFRGAGLEKIDVIYPGLLSYVLYYNPDAFPYLNIGSERMVRITFFLDRLFLRSWPGEVFSFATLSMWKKPTL